MTTTTKTAITINDLKFTNRGDIKPTKANLNRIKKCPIVRQGRAGGHFGDTYPYHAYRVGADVIRVTHYILNSEFSIEIER